MTAFAMATLERAREVVGAVVPPTPQYAWPLLAAEVGAAEVWVKHENHTPTGAFKVRGGVTYIDRMRRERPHVAGVITATRGNHGQSIALAGRNAGVPVTIVVPEGNSPDKNAAMRAFGAELVVFGHDFQAAREHMIELAAERGLEPVPSFHVDLVVGVSTYAAELFDAAEPLDVVYVPIGMGSGICGMIAVRDLLGLHTDVVGVVASGAPAYLRSFEAGRVVTTDAADTFVDGVACRVPDAEAVAEIVRGAARVIAVDDDASAEAVRVLLRTTHNLVEPAGAIATAGMLSERDQLRGKRVGVVMSGGNLDAALLTEILAGRTPRP